MATSAFHDEMPASQENTVKIKTSLNVRRAKKARVVAEGSDVAASIAAGQWASHWELKSCFRNLTQQR